MLCQQMTVTAAASLVGENWHQVAAIYERYVALAPAQTDPSAARALAIDETSGAWAQLGIDAPQSVHFTRRSVASVEER